MKPKSSVEVKESIEVEESVETKIKFEVKEIVETKMKHWGEIEGDRRQVQKTWSHSTWPRRRREGKLETEVKQEREVKHWSDETSWN